MKDVKRVDAYTAGEFCEKVQALILEGYRFDFESNENYPTAFGSFYSAGMVREEVNVNIEVVASKEQVEQAVESLQEVKTTRKSRKDNS